MSLKHANMYHLAHALPQAYHPLVVGSQLANKIIEISSQIAN